RRGGSAREGALRRGLPRGAAGAWTVAAAGRFPPRRAAHLVPFRPVRLARRITADLPPLPRPARRDRQLPPAADLRAGRGWVHRALHGQLLAPPSHRLSRTLSPGEY